MFHVNIILQNSEGGEERIYVEVPKDSYASAVYSALNSVIEGKGPYNNDTFNKSARELLHKFVTNTHAKGGTITSMNVDVVAKLPKFYS